MEFAEKNGVDVVAIHPSTCLGSLQQPYLNASCAVLQQLLQGSKETQEYHWLGAVHVKDVAKAQVLLFRIVLLIPVYCSSRWTRQQVRGRTSSPCFCQTAKSRLLAKAHLRVTASWTSACPASCARSRGGVEAVVMVCRAVLRLLCHYCSTRITARWREV